MTCVIQSMANTYVNMVVPAAIFAMYISNSKYPQISSYKSLDRCHSDACFPGYRVSRTHISRDVPVLLEFWTDGDLQIT